MKIQYENKEFEIEEKIKISKLFKEEILNCDMEVIGAILNNEYVNLEKEIDQDSKIELIDISTKEGMKIYRRTLLYILGKAFEKVCSNQKMIVNYQLPNSMFCTIDDIEINEKLLKDIENEMRNIINNDLPIHQVIMTRDEAEKLYDETDTTKGRLQFDIEENQEIYMYYCEDYFNYFYDIIGNKTGITKVFEIEKYGDGFILRYPDSKNPHEIVKKPESKKLAWALEEYDDIYKILDMNTIYKLNKAIKNNKIRDVILLSEALHEKKIANIADSIAKDRKIKMILIAGPSSSGKTTFAERLGIQLRLNRIKPVTISVDNYFVERSKTPIDEDGKYDFEAIEAIDLELFNDHLTRLLNGEEVEIPEFDFQIGTKKYNGKKIKLEQGEVLVIEGIHCLNDKLTSKISKDQKYKVYISALTVLNMDRFNRISTTDTRLIRRMVRDHQFRGYNAIHTLDRWRSVNRGEEKNIFPFQEDADSIFNTSLIYELGALKPLAEPLLKNISQDKKEYAEAKRILDMLQYFKPIPENYIPDNSLLKEFLGKGAFVGE